MGEHVAAVLVDNGEPFLERSAKSLRNQTEKIELWIAPGPKTDMELAKSLGDVIMPPERGIGKARVNAILNAESDYILSCDSDTEYAPNYAEIALQDLKLLPVVKAGIILPRKDYPEDDLLLAWLEAISHLLVPYEYCLAFRKSAFLNAGIHLFDYESNPRADIGFGIHVRMSPLLSDPRMVCWTRLPTKGALMVRDEFLPSMLGVVVPYGALGTLVLVAGENLLG